MQKIFVKKAEKDCENIKTGLYYPEFQKQTENISNTEGVKNGS